MAKRNNSVFKGLHIVAWVIFVGLCIEAGGLTVNFILSYYTLSIGFISYLAQQTAKNLQHRGFEIDTHNQFWADSQAYILMAAVIYVIATIFARGVEIQNENDLTV